MHGERPKVVVTVDLPTLTGAQPGLAIGGTRAVPLSAEAARRRCCDAGITRVITDGPSLVLDVGRSTRTVSPQLRTAITTRDQHCRFPGCHAPPRFGEIHHLIHWTRGGPTDRANLVLLCWRHHRLVHHSAWTVTGDAQTMLTFRAPDTTTYPSTPPPPASRWGPSPRRAA